MQLLKGVLLGMTLSATALASGKHAGGHADKDHHGMEAHHQGEHGMAGHHGPGAWNAPPEAAARPNPVPADAESLARGKEIFERNCVVCHGSAGEGNGPMAASLNPPPADLQVMVPLHPPGDLAWKIEEGRGPMSAWKETLSERQIWDTVNYLTHGLDDTDSVDKAHEGHGEHDDGATGSTRGGH